MVKPIGPDDVVAMKGPRMIPESVTATFNAMIVERWNGVQSRMTRAEVVGSLIAALGVTEQEILHGRYLDVEPLYRDAGWGCEYHSPELGEDFEAFYVFWVR